MALRRRGAHRAIGLAAWTRTAIGALAVQPFEAFLAVACVLNGLPLALGLEGKSSIAGLVGPGALQVWGLMLTAGGLLVIFGMVMGRPRREHAGLVLLGYGALAYAVSIVVVNGIRGIIAASIIGAFGLACISHARVLNLGR